MLQTRLMAFLIVLAAAACASGPSPHRLGEYGTLQPMFSTPQNQRTPTQITVNLTAPAYVAALFVVPGRGTAIVYPVDSATYNHVDAGQHVIPIHFAERAFNRDSMNFIYRRQGQEGNRRPQPARRDTMFRDSTGRVDTMRIGVLRDPSVAASPIGYLLLVASPNTIPYATLKRRVEGVTIPIDDDEALSTVMKLVKATLADGSPLAGYAQELDRG